MDKYEVFVFGCKHIRRFLGFRGTIIVDTHFAVLVGHIPNMPYFINDNDNHPLWT